jgi:hypothetical protein
MRCVLAGIICPAWLPGIFPKVIRGAPLDGFSCGLLKNFTPQKILTVKIGEASSTNCGLTK